MTTEERDLKISQILNDLYLMDPEFKNHEPELKEIISEMLEAKPDTKFDQEFAKKLKMKLLVPKKPVVSWTEKLRSMFDTPALGLVGAMAVLVLALVGWKLFFGKPPVPAKFTLKATVADSAGVDTHSSFTLRSTQPLSDKEIKQIVKFDPAVDFNIKKVSEGSALFKSALAAETSGTGTYVYELAPQSELKSDTIYQAVIDDAKYADREYAWAFQIKSAFQVIKTTPGNKTNYVPLNTGIEMTFNRENLVDFSKYFDISPKVDGKFQVEGDTAVFMPSKELDQNTVYTVTIKKGLAAKGTDDILAQDYVFAFETSGAGGNPQTAYVNFNDDFIETLPGKQPDLGVYFGNIDQSQLHASVYKMSDPNEFIKTYEDRRNWNWNWTSYYRQNAPRQFDSKGRQSVVDFTPTIITQGYQNYIEIPQQLPEGLYVIEVTSPVGNIKQQLWLQVTPVAHYFSVMHDNSLLWVYDFPSKQPVKNASITFTKFGQGDQKLASTNGDGLAQFDTPSALQDDSGGDKTSPAYFKIEYNGQTSFARIADYWGYGSNVASSGDKYWKYLSTDRFTYQPTDTIKFWGVIKGRTTDIRQQKVTVALYDAYANNYYSDPLKPYANAKPIASVDTTISAFDTVSGQLSLRGADPQGYNVVVLMDDKVINSAYVEVMAYTKPAYQITVTSSKQAIYAGDSVDFNVKAAFFDGTPVANMQLNYSGYWDNEISGTVTLDQNGEGKITITPQYSEGQYVYYPRSLEVEFTPTQSEESDITGTGYVLVFGPHLYLQARQEKQDGDNFTFRAKVNDIDVNGQVPDDDGGFRTEYIGKPTANYPIKAVITKTWYTKDDTGTFYDPINKTVEHTYQYTRHDDTFANLQGTTDSNGEYVVTYNLPKQPDTYYSTEFQVTDQQGRNVKQQAYAYYFSYDYWQPSGLSMNINGQSYDQKFSVGDPVKLDLSAQGNLQLADNQPILIYRYQNNIQGTNIIHGMHFEENFDGSFVPSVQYRAVTLGPYGFSESNVVTATFNSDDRKLTVDISPTQQSYRPGDNATVNIHVKDKDGKPVSAETNIAMVDEAVFHVLPYTWQAEILSSLYQPIYTSPLTGSTTYLLPESGGGGGGAEKGGCFLPGTEILMANSKTKAIENLLPGDQILTFDSEQNKSFRVATIQGTSYHYVDEYLDIDGLEVTPEHTIFLNGKWDFAGNAKAGDTLVLENGKTHIIKNVAQVAAPKTKVYNIVVGKYHTYIANGFYVHNAEKGGTPRENFVDTANYQTVRTDASGNAQIQVKLPDNITSWRVTARAYDSQGLKAGENSKLVKATLPLFVDTVTSDTYLEGDSPVLKVRLFGTNYQQGKQTEITVTSDELKLSKQLTTTSQVAYVPLGTLPAGDIKLTISGKQGNLQDALVKKFTVVKSYFQTPTSATVKITEGHPQLTGNSNGMTTVQFTDAGKGQYYQNLQEASWHWGLRSDQLVASHYAAKLLQQYFDPGIQVDDLNLDNYYDTSGGIRLLPYTDPDLELSAKIADLAASDIYTDKLANYFNGSLKDNKTDIHRSAIALYGLASLKQPVLVKLQALRDTPELTSNDSAYTQDKVYVALGLAKLGDKEEARVLYEQSIRPHINFDAGQAWFQEQQDTTKRVKLTSAAAVLTAYLGEQDDSKALWNYLQSHYPIKDLDVVERVLFLGQQLAKSNSTSASFTFNTGSFHQDVKLENGQPQVFRFTQDDLSKLTFSNVKGEIDAISFFNQYQDPGSLAKNNKLSITREYSVNGKNTTAFRDGDEVLVTLHPSISGSAAEGQYQVVDYLPSGLKPLDNNYDYYQPNQCNVISWPSKISGNAVYFTLYNSTYQNFCKTDTVQYRARIVSAGSFTANPAIIQSVDDLSSLNLSGSQQIQITQ